ncbi:DEAD/DEAH box helicase family protein [Halomonas sp. PAMB 3264]|uniref:DEAD/DEAH box helicase family protein n=1 Tax=Halomonas sp. PAMB 3264 TaxID=3075222 RepID=UPI002899DF02|nr:DEAD/DEAH box helicase family protein [Halomonas sp. PAMB 3264]WNL43520.1 DEAD/DEAH box helicase family protein [Halomonas sp. PAMB 3264]
MRYIYIYETPESKAQGLIKIGEANDVEQRIQGQLNTASAFDAASLAYELLYKTAAVRDECGTAFTDHHIHDILVTKGYHKHQITEGSEVLKGSTEWFEVKPEKAIHLIEQYKSGRRAEEIDIERFQDFPMRPEQAVAVEQTRTYFNSQPASNAPIEMLWNAKMRFGKTFTAYQLARAMGFAKVLVLTYKPAVESAWQEDLEQHVDFKDYVFLRRETLGSINDYLDKKRKVVAFASYQDILGTQDVDTQIKSRHRQLFDTHWDIVIIDEFHYGAGTKKAMEMLADEVEAEKGTKKELTEREKELFAEEEEELAEVEASDAILEAVEKSISSLYRLYLSGTPFKAMADARFDSEAIFNWTYTDEQKAKEAWAKAHPDALASNPYRSLPQIQMFLYKVSEDLIKAGLQEGKDEFSLNHFFKAKRRAFLNETAVKKWLDLISGVIRPYTEVADELLDEVRIQPSQYPFDHDSGLFQELDHTLWYLNRVDSAYALKQALETHAVFRHFHIILAAGTELGSGVEAVKPVRDAIKRHPKTITLSVGKLTTGVSIPEWKAVMFLRDVASPENYFQTAFRAQTPYTDPKTGKMKETCYIFDFSPNRSLKLLTTYSEKLSTDSHLTTSEEKLSEFIHYLPVLKVAGNQMVSMDAREVMTFDLSGIDAKGLGERFQERKNVVVTRDTINAINATEQSQARCQAIFDRIKMFRKYNGASDKDMTDADANVIDLDANDKRIKELKTKEPTTPKEEKKRDKELGDAEKQMKSEREKVRELLRTLLSRIPIFMYLTDATEENLEQVLVESENDLFRKTTGIEIGDFRYLVAMGLLKIESLDGYILKFIQLENQNYEVVNRMED